MRLGAHAGPSNNKSPMRSGLFLAMMLAASSLAAAETPLTIDQLLAQGWEIAGYASGYDNRTSLILFRHPGRKRACPVRHPLRRDARSAHSRQLLRAAVSPVDALLGKGRLARRAAEGVVVAQFWRRGRKVVLRGGQPKGRANSKQARVLALLCGPSGATKFATSQLAKCRLMPCEFARRTPYHRCWGKSQDQRRPRARIDHERLFAFELRTPALACA